MYLFALSTAEQGASAALFERDRLICESFWAGSKSHSRRLMSMVQEVVEDRAGLNLFDVDRFVAARGPGSFTGLRIGISVVKGLAAAVCKPCAGVSSLDGIAWRFAAAAGPVCVMMDARRQEVYTATFWFDRGQLVKKSPEQVCSPVQAIKTAGADALFAGSGSKAYEGLIQATFKTGAMISPGYMDGVNAAAIGAVAMGAPDFFSRPENSLVPVYLRKSDAEIHYSKKSAS